MNEINKRDYERFLYLKRGYSKGGIKTALKNFNVIKQWFTNNKRSLTVRAVEDFFVQKKNDGYKNNTLLNYYTTFKLLEHFTGKNLLGDIKSPKKNREIPHILTDVELVNLFNVNMNYGRYQGKSCQRLNNVYKTLIQFLYYMGCRISEAQNLKVKYVLPNSQVHFIDTKNKEDRIVYLFPACYGRVKKLIKNRHAEDYVFRSMTGNKFSLPEFEKDLKARAKKAGIKKRIYPHLFRHTLASHLAIANVDIRIVQKILGHKDLSSTMYYTQLNMDKQVDAIHTLPIAQVYLPAKDRMKRLKKIIEEKHLEDDPRLEYSLRETTRYGKKGLVVEVFEA